MSEIIYKNDIKVGKLTTASGDIDVKISNVAKSTMEITHEHLIGSATASIATYLYSAEGYITKSLTGTHNNQNGKLYYYFKVPNDFGSIDSSNVVNIFTMLSNSDKTFTLTMYKNGVADTNINAVSVSPGTDNVMTKFSFVPAGTYTYEDNIMFMLEATDIDNNEYFETQGLFLNYNKKII